MVANSSHGDGVSNVFRDSPLRYFGYANEIGESFRYQYPKVVTPSYVLAFGYCFADAISAGYIVLTESNDTTQNHKRSKRARAAIATIDTLTWQSLASVALPGGIINMIVRGSKFAVARSGLPVLVSKWLPTVTGLGSIPLIITPIDDLVDFTLDNSTRKLLQVGRAY